MSDFDALVAEHGPAIRRVAASYEHDPGLAEDLTQDMLVAIWRAWPRFRGEASPRTFVLRIAHNRGASHALTQSRQPRSTDQIPDMSSPEGSALDRAERQEQADRLLAAARTRLSRSIQQGEKQINPSPHYDITVARLRPRLLPICARAHNAQMRKK